MCRLRNIAMHDYQESVTTGQTLRWTDRRTDAGQSDSYVPLCFAGDTKIILVFNKTVQLKEKIRGDINIVTVPRKMHQFHKYPDDVEF